MRNVRGGEARAEKRSVSRHHDMSTNALRRKLNAINTTEREEQKQFMHKMGGLVAESCALRGVAPAECARRGGLHIHCGDHGAAYAAGEEEYLEDPKYA